MAAASFLPQESHGCTLAGGLAWPRIQESRALWLEIQQPASFCFHDRMTRQWRDFVTCQSDGADLSPANLSCPGQ